jgi:hypothetical protein
MSDTWEKSFRKMRKLIFTINPKKMKHKIITILLASSLVAAFSWNFIGCQSPTVCKTIDTPEHVTLKFHLRLDPDVYKNSYFKKPPQFALWLEQLPSRKIRTVWVTYYTATGDWGPGIVRPVSLPYWVSRWNLETQTLGDPTPNNPAVDAVTGATPKTVLVVETPVPAETVFDYFIEVNVSGDYNETFPAVKEDGTPDQNGNGQPSIIYKGRITSSSGRKSTPRLVGRTDQWQAVDHIITDLKNITTAKNLFSEINVSCHSHASVSAAPTGN